MHAANELVMTRCTPFLEDAVWECSANPPESVRHPDELPDVESEWYPVSVPGTAASALRAAGRWSFEAPFDIDGSDWWFRTTFAAPSRDHGCPHHLCFDGLATLAEVWLNGESILTTDNMFRGYRLEITDRLRHDNELAIVCRSIHHDLKRKRPRPRWKTNLVQHQQLRWLRASLLGRIPGWSPPVPAVGPWRPVRLEHDPVQITQRHIQTRLDGTTGVVSLRIRLATSTTVDGATLRVGNHQAPLTIEMDETHTILSGELRIEHAPPWWPHTHGTPTLLTCGFSVTIAGREQSFDCPAIGFRRLESITQDGGFGLRINGVPVFCRGACWTVNDIFTLTGTPAALEHDLRLARDAGVNMLRIGGTMAYESDEFYSLCDRLGILVWQDFAFANMDYPVLDASFRRNIEQEAVEQLQRLAGHPSVVVYCGSSEIEQQAAMLGLPRDSWTNDWFAQQLPALCAVHHPGTAYVPSTPTGGALPFHPRAGLTHYYGVGAYLRTIEDVRRTDVRFTPECLGFSNLPDDPTIHALTGGSAPVIHSPRWKQRIPRDSGAGWDFEDVRDHYLRELFHVDPVELRSRNLPRYLQLGRIATGEMMARTFSEWRSQHSRTLGALVWFYKDLWPGAGWGIVDSMGLPKAAYYALKRVWNSRQLTLTDEGLNGLHLHLTNETNHDCTGFLEIELLREPNITIAQEEVTVSVPARSRQMFIADDILGRFYDVSYAYRFGPPQHDVVLATWYDDQRRPISEAVHLIQRRDPLPAWPVQVESSAELLGNGAYQVHLRSDSFLHAVQLTAAGYLPSDNFFPLGPNRRKAVTFRPILPSPPAFRAEYNALNLNQSGFILDRESHA